MLNEFGITVGIVDTMSSPTSVERRFPEQVLNGRYPLRKSQDFPIFQKCLSLRT
jgi:hypothetical protein